MSDTADRFRNEQFVAAWSRWHAARHAWDRVVRRHAPLGTGSYDPDPSALRGSVSHFSPVAQEFLDARTAYRVECSRWNMDGIPDSP